MARQTGAAAWRAPAGHEPPPLSIEPRKYWAATSGGVAAISPCTIWPIFWASVILSTSRAIWASMSASCVIAGASAGQLAYVGGSAWISRQASTTVIWIVASVEPARLDAVTVYAVVGAAIAGVPEMTPDGP